MNEQGVFTYNGIASDGPSSVMRTSGITANTFQAKFILGANLPAYGSVSLWFGNKRITLNDCRVGRQIITGGSDGRWREITFEDRRWRWRYPVIYGQYNTYAKGLKVTDVQNIRNPRQLASLCLTAMGETIPDLSALPTDVYPTTLFSGQNAAEQLEALCEQFGCRVNLEWSDRVSIVRSGVGRNPPTDSRIMDFVQAYEPPIIPEQLIIEAGKTYFQVDLKLKAVGEESNTKEIKDIDDLSYKPTGGWGDADLGKFTEVNEKLRDLAKANIYRVYKVDLNTSVTLPIPQAFKVPKGQNTNARKYFTITKSTLWRILPLESRQLKLYKPANTDDDDLTEAQVIGYFTDERLAYMNNKEPTPTSIAHDEFTEGLALDAGNPEYIFSGGVSIDGPRGLARVSAPCYRINRNNNGPVSPNHLPALIVLRTSFPLRDPVTRDFVRQQYVYRPSNGVRGLIHTVRVEELTYEIGLTEETDRRDFEREAEFYALKEIAKYKLGDSATIPAKGWLFDVNTDGAIRSVRFDKDQSGACTTSIEWQTENPVDRITYKEQRERIKVAEAVRNVGLVTIEDIKKRD